MILTEKEARMKWCPNTFHFTDKNGHEYDNCIASECMAWRWGEEKRLAQHQPCGCQICICEDDEQCHGCGAKSCGTHPPMEIPNPVYLERRGYCGLAGKVGM